MCWSPAPRVSTAARRATPTISPVCAAEAGGGGRRARSRTPPYRHGGGAWYGRETRAASRQPAPASGLAADADAVRRARGPDRLASPAQADAAALPQRRLSRGFGASCGGRVLDRR